MPEVCAIMMTKNEADIIEEVLLRYEVEEIPVFIMDDSDDGTYDILKQYNNVDVFRQEKVYGRNVTGSGDWMFQAVLSRKREMIGTGNYVIIGMGDEIWYHNPVRAIWDMETENASVCIVHSCQFFLHKNDMEKWDFLKKRWKEPYDKMTNRERLHWYSPGYIAERRIFFDDGTGYYPKGCGFDPLPQGVAWKQYTKNPIVMHFPMRNPTQVLERAKDRVERDYQPFYHHSYNKKPEDVFFKAFPGFDKANCFDGDFGKWEKGMEYLL